LVESACRRTRSTSPACGGGRRARKSAAGGGRSILSTSAFCGSTPTPTLPREERERECTSIADPARPNLIKLEALAIDCRWHPRRRPIRLSNSGTDATPRSRGAKSARVVVRTTLEKQRAQGRPGAHRTHGPRATKKHAAEPQVQADHPAFPAQWFYGLYVLSPVTGLFCHRHFRGIVSRENLAPASGRQDHTISPSASAAFVNAQPKRPPHPASNVRDDRDTPLLWRRDTRKMLLIWGFEQYRRPAAQWHDGQFSHDAYARFARRAVAVSEAWEGTLLSPFKTRC
jgi:hypothetical protein